MYNTSSAAALAGLSTSANFTHLQYNVIILTPVGGALWCLVSKTIHLNHVAIVKLKVLKIHPL